MSESDTPPRGEAHDLVVFKTARTPIEAELIRGVLNSAEIPAFVEGGMLNDEFAMSQRLMNIGAVTIKVPRSRLAEAHAALAEARESASEVDEAARATMSAEAPSEPTAAPPRRSGPGWVLPVLLGLAAVVFLVQWLETRAALRFAMQSGLTRLEPGAAGELVYRWTENDLVAGRMTDADGNGVAEVHTSYSRSGRPLSTGYDRDQNGIWEKITLLAANGDVVATIFDDDQDGVAERVEEDHGVHTIVLVDADQDRRMERLEQRDETGKLVRAWRWDAELGLADDR